MARKAVLLLLRSAFILLCKLLLVDVVCSFVSGWLCYFLFMRKIMAHPNSKNESSQDETSIQVIICGFPRNGSRSLWKAMEILGFPCFHGAHLYKPSTATLYMKAYTSGTPQEWANLLHGYKSIADAPAACSYKELIDIYPNAKVILNIRDSNRWYNSFSQTLLQNKQSLVIQVVQPFATRCYNVSFYKKLVDKPESKESSINNYRQHVEEVKRHVPSHKLFILDIEKNEGWAPLCTFLEVPIPNVPFPFINKREYFTKTFHKLRATYWIVLLLYLAIFFITIIATSKCILLM